MYYLVTRMACAPEYVEKNLYFKKKLYIEPLVDKVKKFSTEHSALYVMDAHGANLTRGLMDAEVAGEIFPYTRDPLAAADIAYLVGLAQCGNADDICSNLGPQLSVVWLDDAISGGKAVMRRVKTILDQGIVNLALSYNLTSRKDLSYRTFFRSVIHAAVRRGYTYNKEECTKWEYNKGPGTTTMHTFWFVFRKNELIVSD